MALLRKLLLCIVLLACTLLSGNAQQICVREECSNELHACDQTCQAKMGDCYFKCTLLS